MMAEPVWGALLPEAGRSDNCSKTANGGLARLASAEALVRKIFFESTGGILQNAPDRMSSVWRASPVAKSEEDMRLWRDEGIPAGNCGDRKCHGDFAVVEAQTAATTSRS